MIDPLTLSLAIGSIIISILSYIKHSSCCGIIEIDTISPLRPTPNQKEN